MQRISLENVNRVDAYALRWGCVRTDRFLSYQAVKNAVGKARANSGNAVYQSEMSSEFSVEPEDFLIFDDPSVSWATRWTIFVRSGVVTRQHILETYRRVLHKAAKGYYAEQCLLSINKAEVAGDTDHFFRHLDAVRHYAYEAKMITEGAERRRMMGLVRYVRAANQVVNKEV